MASIPDVDTVPIEYTGINITTIFVFPLFVLYVVVWLLIAIGSFQLQTYFKTSSQQDLQSKVRASDFEGVSILRPLKGIDPQMDWCLESSFKQNYPHDKLEIIFCVQSESDPAIPIVRELMKKYPDVDSKLLVDSNQRNFDYFGPNPKVNNLHKGYKSAKYDILWILDSNVYTNPDTLQRSVYTLKHNLNNGSNTPTILGLNKTVKLVTHVPIVVSTSKHRLNWGAKLDEMFMSTSHAKFYTAFNRLQLAPCINGKSNLYRRSDLDMAVENITYQPTPKGEGLKHFSKYIGEDNMIGIALWEGVDGCAGMSRDIVVQPITGQNSVKDYINRRVRWLRVRKYMVLAATLLEPTTESIFSGIIGSFSLNVLFSNSFKINWIWFLFHMVVWFTIDFFQFKKITSLANDALNFSSSFETQEFTKFWLLRELLALPIWVIAMCGSAIDWRGQQFQILSDLSAETL